MCHVYQTLSLFYIAQVIEGIKSVNVALNKNGKFCNRDDLPTPHMMDGNTDIASSIRFKNSCENGNNSFVMIYLLEKYSIQFVLIYQGSTNANNELDYLKSYLREDNRNILCSEHPFKVPAPGRVIRLNCQPRPELFSEFQINGVGNIGFDVAEVELHTLATDLPNVRNVLIYRGCFESLGTENDFELNLFGCQRYCLNKDYSFIGIKANKYCRCGGGFDLKKEVPKEKCGLKCEDDIRNCGGKDNYAVYIVKPPLPWYMGCYESSSYPSQNDFGGTIEMCLHHCNNYKYARLQDGNCECTDDNMEGSLSVSAKCDFECPGNPAETCGALISIAQYKTCKTNSDNFISCSELFQCDSNIKYDKYGRCARCKPGFIGDYCFETEPFFDKPTTAPKELTVSDKPTTLKPTETETNITEYSILKQVMKNFYLIIPALTLFCLACLFCVKGESQGKTTSAPYAVSVPSTASA